MMVESFPQGRETKQRKGDRRQCYKSVVQELTS